MLFKSICLMLMLLCPQLAQANFGLLLPKSAYPQKEFVFTIGAVDPFSGQGLNIERPQAFSSIFYNGQDLSREDYLSSLQETTAYGANAFTATIPIASTQPGIYHFTMQTKAIWLPEANHFVQYRTKVIIPVNASTANWILPPEDSLEIVALTRPFGLKQGQNFTAQILKAGKPVPSLIEIAHLTSQVRINFNPKKPPKFPKPKTPYQAMQATHTDPQGVFNFTFNEPGWWAFSLTQPGEPLQNLAGALKPVLHKTQLWVYVED